MPDSRKSRFSDGLLRKMAWHGQFWHDICLPPGSNGRDADIRKARYRPLLTAFHPTGDE